MSQDHKILVVNPDTFTDPSSVANPEFPRKLHASTRSKDDVPTNLRTERAENTDAKTRANLPCIRHENQFENGPQIDDESRSSPRSFLARRLAQIDHWMRRVIRLTVQSIAFVIPWTSSDGSLARVSQSPSLRILILGINYGPELTGIAPYTSSLAGGLAAEGHQVRVRTTHPHYPEWTIRAGYGQWKRTEVIDGVTVERLRHYVPKSPSSIKRLVSEITFGMRATIGRWHGPDVIIMLSPALFSSGLANMRKLLFHRNVPSVVWVQDLYGLGVSETGAAGSGVAKFIASVESRLLRSATGVVVIHKRFAEHVQSKLKVDPRRVKVVRNWTHLPASVPQSHHEIRQRLGWKDSEAIALHAGNIGAKQALENVVEAARLADKSGEKIRFVLLGRGNQRESVELSASGVERIQFIDPLPGDEFQQAMAAADVLIVNEKRGLAEMAVPSKLTSYFSTGLPVVAATDAGSITADEIASSQGGVRVDAEDPAALLRAVRDLAANPSLAASFGKRGHDFRESVLSENAAIGSYAAWLCELAVRGPRGLVPDVSAAST